MKTSTHVNFQSDKTMKKTPDYYSSFFFVALPEIIISRGKK